MARYIVRVARRVVVAGLFVAVACLGTLSGLLFAYAGDLPQISALDDYQPSTITRVHAAGGEVIGEFATERRVVIGDNDIGQPLRQAILAAEDAGFERHVGVAISRIVIALMRDAVERRLAQGASTLTQQLARNLFLTPQKTWERKVKEAILAIQIEKRYTKREIFTFYCNQMYFGHGAYGVEAASRLYFGKAARQLSVEEAALIAALLQRPEAISPFVDMRRAIQRRNYVLNRMAEERFITRAQADTLKTQPIVLKGQPRRERSVAPYFVEEVRKYLEQQYGAKRLYESGLAVRTSLDVRLQRAANRAIDEGLRRIDKRQGYRPRARNVLDEGTSVEQFTHEAWRHPYGVGDVVPGVIAAVEGSHARLRLGRHMGDLGPDGSAWTGRRSAAQLVRVGDLVEARILKLNDAARTAVVALEQTPAVEGALVALDNRTGQIRAMVGGFSFDRSKFNRATQALRQVGSAFKPFVYTAAIDRGYTPASVIIDAPASYPGGAGQPPYSPLNYDRKFEGAITLRRAIEQSRNVPAVRLTDHLGPGQVVAYARRFGISSPLPPYLSLALGSAEVTLVELTSAYSVFPNQGVRLRPYSILKVYGRDGTQLEENRPEPHDAIRADTAYVLTNLLRGVVLRGTAVSASSIDWPLAGKTGTVDDYTDAWFIGFDPDITVGVWIGRDEKKPIGEDETGSRAALPIWIEFMKAYMAGRTDPPRFEPPGNIVFVAVDRATGAPAGSNAPDALAEAFISGTQPGGAFVR